MNLNIIITFIIMTFKKIQDLKSGFKLINVKHARHLKIMFNLTKKQTFQNFYKNELK